MACPGRENPCDLHASGSRLEDAGQDLDGGRLAGSVGPEQSGDFPRSNLEADAVQNFRARIAEPEVLYDD